MRCPYRKSVVALPRLSCLLVKFTNKQKASVEPKFFKTLPRRDTDFCGCDAWLATATHELLMRAVRPHRHRHSY